MGQIAIYLVRGTFTKTEFDKQKNLRKTATEDRYTYKPEFADAFNNAMTSMVSGSGTLPPYDYLVNHFKQGFYSTITSSLHTESELHAIFDIPFEILWDEIRKEDVARYSVYFVSGVEIIDNGCRNDNDGNIVLRDGNIITATPYACEADRTPPNPDYNYNNESNIGEPP